MKILAFSDIHASASRTADIIAEAPKADLIIGAGDFCNRRQGLEDAVRLFWPYADKCIFVPGNAESADELRAATEATVLHGDSVERDGLTIVGLGYGVPRTPFGEWSCDLTDIEAAQMLTPFERADILISHSPPKGIADQTSQGLSIGSEAIRNWIARVQPAHAVCGHIHDSWGQSGMIGRTLVRNLGPTPNWIEMNVEN